MTNTPENTLSAAAGSASGAAAPGSDVAPVSAAPFVSASAPMAQLFICMAVELVPGERDFSARSHAPLAAMLSPSLAGALAERVASDLHKLTAETASLDLLMCGALYDTVEVLRPVWRLHQELVQLAARAPRKPAAVPAGDELAGHGRIIAFGAADGKMPGTLQPDPEFGAGPLLLLPIVLQGAPDKIATVTDIYERNLLETGMASAETALLVQEAFGIEVEHTRYLTAWDLAAMMQLQYEHAGFGLLWPLIEAAALRVPSAEITTVDQPPEPRMVAQNGHVHFNLKAIGEWTEHHAAALGVDPKDINRVERLFRQFELRQRQLADILGAHAIPTVWDSH